MSKEEKTEKKEEKPEKKEEKSEKIKPSETKHKEAHHKPLSSKTLKASFIVPAAIIAVILLLFVVQVRYQAKESYIEIIKYEETVTRTIEDTNNPQQTTECEMVDASADITSYRPYIQPYGSKFQCIAEMLVKNQEKVPLEWTFSYAFTVNGDEIVTAPKTYEIPALGAVDYIFKIDGCNRDDILTGTYETVSWPKTNKCELVTTYPLLTIQETIPKERQEERERIVEKKEPLWQFLLGINKKDKV